MTGRKIPPEEAFSYYANLGPTRSYAAVAAHYHVSKRAITNVAVSPGPDDELQPAPPTNAEHQTPTKTHAPPRRMRHSVHPFRGKVRP